MRSARRSRRPGSRCCRPEARLPAALLPLLLLPLLLLPLLLLLGACGAGAFQRSLPERADHFAARSVGGLQVGFGRADITPRDPQYLAGFNLNRPYTAVQSPLYVRTMLLRVGGEEVAICGIDNLGLQREDVEWIKDGLPGIAKGRVFLCASHTHAAPDLVGLWGFYFMTSGREQGYLRQVAAGVRRSLDEARRGLQPASLHWGESRAPREGLIRNSNRKDLFNPRVSVLQARGRDGRELGALLHLACHPEMFRRRHTVVSADMAGAFCDAWEAAGRGRAVFVNGELGAMITPGFRPRGEEGMPLVGQALLRLGEAALAAARPVEASELEVRRRDIFLPLETPGLSLGRLTGVIRRELYAGNLRSSVGYLRLGDFECLAVPGELEPSFANELRMRLRKPRLLILGLCDDEVGYLLRRQEALDPEYAYERSMSPGVDAGERMRRAITGAAPARSGG